MVRFRFHVLPKVKVLHVIVIDSQFSDANYGDRIRGCLKYIQRRFASWNKKGCTDIDNLIGVSKIERDKYDLRSKLEQLTSGRDQV